MDGDLQHPPEKIKEIVKELRKGNDLVAGARKKVFHWPLDILAGAVVGIFSGWLVIKIFKLIMNRFNK